jgi:hypothetical protein
VPFRAKGIPTALQVQNHEGEKNPNNHTPLDSIAHMNLDYWLEQIKATIAIASYLAVPFVHE